MTDPATAPVRALLAEDEPLLAEGLVAELGHAWPELAVVARVGDGLSAVREALALKPEVCFLDIRMPGMDGLEAARALAEDWPEDAAPFPLLVFVTAYDQYALQAFERQAVDYLLKPVDPARLAQTVARLRRTLQDRRGAQPADAAGLALQQAIGQLRALIAPTGPAGSVLPPATGTIPAPPRLEVIQATAPTGGAALLHLVPVDEVVYFEAADKYVRVITATRELLVRTSLRELLPRLDPAQFWQVHRGTVVRARCITSARREESGKVTLTLAGRPETVTASRLYAHLFKPL